MKFGKVSTVLCAILATGCASYSGNSNSTQASSVNSILTTETGMTLYTFDKDASNKSNCYDACAIKWPPYNATEGERPSASAKKSTRSDGSEQWTVDSKPLYTWIGDTKPGDTTGDGVGNVWHTAIESVQVKAREKAKSAY